jgi:hypothetical protein
MVEFQLDLFLQVGSLGLELVFELSDFSSSFLNQFLKVSFVIFAFGHILDGQQNHIGLAALAIDPSGIQMHDFGADGFKGVFHLKIMKRGVLRKDVFQQLPEPGMSHCRLPRS